MPSRADDRVFSPRARKKGASRKAHASMVRQYGEREGERIYHATKNARAKEQGKRGVREAMRARSRRRSR